MFYMYVLIHRRTKRLYIGFSANLNSESLRINTAILIGNWLITRRMLRKLMPVSVKVI